MAHWEALRGGALAPARTALDPRAIASALEFVFVAELVAPTVARLRLSGQRLFDLLGMEPRGMPLSVFLAHDARDALDDALRQVAHGARVSLPLRGARSLGRPGINARMVLLPLTDGKGQINRVLGVLEYHGQVGRTPRVLSMAAGIELVASDIAASVPLSSPTERVRAALGPSRPERPQLRVIQGGLS